jgi:hypothetical protein
MQHGSKDKARQIFAKAITVKPHAPTFVAWARLEYEEGMNVSMKII